MGKPLRTLFLSVMTYPPIGGAPLRNWQNINLMAKFGPVGVFAISDREAVAADSKIVEAWHQCNINEPSSFLTLIERSFRWFRRWGLSFYWCYLSHAAAKLEKVLLTFKPDLVIFEELWLFHYLEIVQKFPCRIIFDEHNIELSVYKETKCNDSSLIAWGRSKLHLPQIRRTERTLIEKADQIWVCSKEDHHLLNKLYGPQFKSYVVPNGIDLRFYDAVWLGQVAPPSNLQPKTYNLLFPGNFVYPPNYEAASLLIDKIFPRLKALYPDCRLMLVGRGADRSMFMASQKDKNIVVTGEVADIRPYLAAASLMIVPLRKGGGTRFKILEAFASGCPVVSTTKGAEGLSVNHGEHLLIGDDIDEVVESIVHLWSSPTFSETLTSNAFQFIRKNYSWEAVNQKLEHAIQELLK